MLQSIITLADLPVDIDSLILLKNLGVKGHRLKVIGNAGGYHKHTS